MNLFERQLGEVDRSDIRGWMRAIEQHINYLQERAEYGFRQLEKRISELERGKGE